MLPLLFGLGYSIEKRETIIIEFHLGSSNYIIVILFLKMIWEMFKASNGNQRFEEKCVNSTITRGEE